MHSLYYLSLQILAWLALCVAAGVGGFLAFVFSRFLDPSVYGINIQIYGKCSESDIDGQVCKCTW